MYDIKVTDTEELIQKTQEYLDYIKEHYWNVRKAWEIIKINCNGSSFSFHV